MAEAARVDETLEALDAVAEAAEENEQASKDIRKRAEQLQKERARGKPWREIIEKEERPRLVEMLSSAIALLTFSGSRLRRAQASELHSNGQSMDTIARLFGVSRQRIAAILRGRSTPG
jgi:predicted transcriptional regulator